MPDYVSERLTQLPSATPHQNSVFQRILGHLTKFNQVLVEYFDYFRTDNELPGGVLSTRRP
jgi:hypothetical protein